MDIRVVNKFKKFNLSDEVLKWMDDMCGMLKLNGQSSDGFRSFCFDYFSYNVDHDNIKNMYEKYRKNPKCKTLERYVIRYGEVLGTEKFKAYCDKQAYSNTFEYKSEKRGWTRERFNQYIKDTTITLDNLVRKYGGVEGNRRWEEFKIKQKDAGISLKFFQNKYGKEKGELKYKEVNKSKRLIKENFIRKYGDDGENKWNEFCERRQTKNSKFYYSKISQELFSELMKQIPDNKINDIFFATKNYEYIFNHTSFENCFFVDFYDKSTHRIIEFNGDYYHANPKLYNEDYFNTKLNKYARDIWKSEKFKLDSIKHYFPEVEILTIWQNEYSANPTGAIEKCLQFLGYKSIFS